MDQIDLILICLTSHLDRTTYNQLSIICKGMLCLSGRVTMLGISRWTGQGGSYRTVQRFFKKNISWISLNWAIIRLHLSKESTILIAGDASIVTKSGKKTFGVGTFFSSLQSRPVRGLAFQALSLIDVKTRKSWPLIIEQMPPKEKKEQSTSEKKILKRGKGRPKGSKNKNKSEVKLNAEMKQVSLMLKQALELTGKTIKPTYFVYDGAFGNNAATQMTIKAGLHLISKLRFDSTLYFPWEGKYSGRGKPKTYGNKIDCKNIPDKYLKSKEHDKEICTEVYQIKALHKNFPEALNVVIICKRNHKTKKSAHMILFTSDLNLGHAEIVDYYSLRFQIEFNFRDAKQHWGLEDFMVTEKEAVQNSADISFWMVNVSQALLPSSNAESILDLKAHYHGLRYAKEALKLLQENPQGINNEAILNEITTIGRIHDVKIAA